MNESFIFYSYVSVAFYGSSLTETTRCGEGLRSSRSASERRGPPEQRGRRGRGRVGRQGVGTSEDVRSEIFCGRIGSFFANESFEKLFCCAHQLTPMSSRSLEKRCVTCDPGHLQSQKMILPVPRRMIQKRCQTRRPC